MAPKRQNSNRQKTQRSDSLLEMLRDLGGDAAEVLTKDLVGELPNDALSQTGLKPKTPQEGTLYSGESREELLAQRERLERRLQRQEVIHRQETTVWSAERQKVEAKVKLLQEEAEKLANATKNLNEKVKVAATQAPVEAGTYHVSFFENLISFIRSLTKKVTDATTWLSLIMVRGKKRSHYWGQVRRSGSKYLLSQERYMSTQAG